MSLTWMSNGFICKDLYAPFVLEKDSDYLEDLKKKYKIVIQHSCNFLQNKGRMGALGSDPIKKIKFFRRL